ncbi:MAG: hypothetical protein LKI59_06420 [Bacteroidales bacterium]|jgi:hypothetical protein|nr:hypothetical protein [Bacteroidales bacterium]
MKIRIAGYLFLLAAVASSAVSCAVEDSDSSGTGDINLMVVSGNVYDKDTMAPLDSIVVILSSYRSSDRTSVSCRDTVLTKKGEYRFLNAVYSDSFVYEITAFDVDGDNNGGWYRRGSILLFASDESPLFNSENKMYYVIDQNFYLEKIQR